jgi:hypothetical protein
MKRIAIVTLATTLAAAAAASGPPPRFYPDDPVWEYPEPADASAVTPRKTSEMFDYLDNSFGEPGERTERRALNINTLDEVPDSSWFANRIGTRPMSADEIARGPDRSTGPAPGRWTVVSAKTEGAAPGFVMRDGEGQLYFVKLDPTGHAEMATAAEVISTKIMHAIGFHVPENYLARVRPADLAIVAAEGKARNAVTREQIDDVFSKAAADSDGSYRVVASKALPGKPIGPFAYDKTRSDDPNDIVPHEHRRELRAMRVFAAWINNADLRSINSLDTLVRDGQRSIVRHHVIDFGSTLGAGAAHPKSPRSGHEYLWDTRRGLVRMATLGLAVPRWARIRYPDHPAIGRFEADHFDPAKWAPHQPNTAYHNMRPDDAFWAARRVMAFSDEAIRSIVRSARYSDPKAEKYIADVLIARRDKIGRVWLTAVNPVVDFRLSPDGVVTFPNAAVSHRVASAPSQYQISWAWFDNQSQAVTPFGRQTNVRETRATAPRELNHRHDSCYVRIEVRAVHPEHRTWALPVHVFFRHDSQGWKTVGLDRLPS